MFNNHLEKSKVSYVQHLCWAILAGFRLIYAGITSIIHGIFPFLFEGTAATTVIDLYHERLVNHPNKDYQTYIEKKQND